MILLLKLQGESTNPINRNNSISKIFSELYMTFFVHNLWRYSEGHDFLLFLRYSYWCCSTIPIEFISKDDKKGVLGKIYKQLNNFLQWKFSC